MGGHSLQVRILECGRMAWHDVKALAGIGQGTRINEYGCGGCTSRLGRFRWGSIPWYSTQPSRERRAFLWGCCWLAATDC